MKMNKFSEALDRHITGNYGEDQFKRVCENCDRVFFDDCDEDDGEALCQECRREKVK